MSATTYAIYSADGEFIGHLSCAPSQLAGNLRDGQTAQPGRVPIETPAPDLKAARKHQIEVLERSQLRALRELALDPNNVEAMGRLKAVDQEIESLRADLLPPAR